MAVDPTTAPEEVEAAVPELNACVSSPGRVVFVEAGNSDGWLATDYTVEPTR
ncbi:MAG: hypothetical protein ABEJ82_01580 [Haloplanus sp.]